MRKYKLFTMGLALTVALTSFCACSSNVSEETSSEELIEVKGVEETEAEEIVPETHITTDSIGSFSRIDELWSTVGTPYSVVRNDASGYTSPCCFDDRYIYVLSAKEAETEDYFYNEYFVNVIDKNTFEEVTMIEIIGESVDFVECTLFSYNGTAYIYSFDYNDMTPRLMKIDADKFTLEADTVLLDQILGTAEESAEDESDDFSFSLRKVFNLNGGVIFLFDDDNFGELNGTYSIVYLKADGTVVRNDQTSAQLFFTDSSDYYISTFMYGEKNLVLRSGQYCKVYDIDTMKETTLSVPYEVLMSYNISAGDNGTYYTNTLEGFFETNPDTDITDKLIDYSLVAGDTSILRDSRFLYADSTGYYFLCSTISSDDYVYDNLISTRLLRISPCENPYSGKQVIDLASAVGDPELIRTIKAYNDSSEDYFIRFHICDGSIPTTYKQLHFDDGDFYTIGDDGASFEQYICNKAKSEKQKFKYLKSSPDIDILYGFGLNEGFNSGEICMDLAPYIPDDDSKYYMNIINAKKNENGELYVVPLVFGFNSLGYYSKEDADVSSYFNSQGGISLGDYTDLVDKYSPNYDPMGVTASNCEIFEQIFDNEADKFIDMASDTQSFDKDVFMQLVDFADLHKETDGAAEFYNEDLTEDVVIDYLHNTSLLDNLVYVWNGEDSDMERVSYKAIPSTDGRGIAATMEQCISVKADTSDKEGSVDFVLYMLDNYSQAEALKDGYNVNRNTNAELQKQTIAHLDSMGCFEDGPEINVQDELNYVESTISNITRFEFRDAIVTYSYLPSLMEYYSGNTNEETFVLNIEKALANAVDEIKEAY